MTNKKCGRACRFEIVDDLETTLRGDQGFGSTGVSGTLKRHCAVGNINTLLG